VGARADIAVATEAINRRQVERVARVVRTHATPGQQRTGVLGLSYKPDTPVVEESQGVMLANRLAAEGFATLAFDPAALADAGTALAPTIARAHSLAECVDSCDVLILMVPWPEFRQIPALLGRRPRKPLVIVDCWRQLAPADLAGLADLVQLGKAWAPSASQVLVPPLA
jgi:UDPglucose 6-dehydrogenase